MAPSTQNCCSEQARLKNVEPATIEGYTNEFKFLESLRGKPNIIQLYDSEVKEGKELTLVMERGEIDFNGLLRRKLNSNGALSTGIDKQYEKQLTMNQICVHWQQMFEAVHTNWYFKLYFTRGTHGNTIVTFAFTILFCQWFSTMLQARSLK